MPLSSQLFQGDPALEAAANDDAAHIMQGARGPHVAKIQTALNTLDDAKLGADGIYGPATANAVLGYKTKRNIINRSYQTSADDIVGKMTMASLDEEMRGHETKPAQRIKLIPISPRANPGKVRARLDFKLTDSNALLPVRASNVFPHDSVTLKPFGNAEIEVENGEGYTLTLGTATFEQSPLAFMTLPGAQAPVTHILLKGVGPKILIKVRAGSKWGTAVLFARKIVNGQVLTERMLIEILDTRPNIFHPTDAHHHEPVSEPKEWENVCDEAAKDPNLGFFLTRFARAKASPETVTNAAKAALGFKPMATFHYDYYLSGIGAVVNEDENIRDWIEGDSQAREVIARHLRNARRGNESPVSVMFEFGQKSFGMFGDDARLSFGTIDNLEARANFLGGVVEVWFEDTYEWHPTYSQYTAPIRCPNPVDRDSLFLHAAAVQMKRRGAKDYQMRGRFTFLIDRFPGLV
jgi:peptidoglycan hydrolase-like protein with peptidoglycan-binding domain